MKGPIDVPRPSVDARSQKCATCRYFAEGWCLSLNDDRTADATGCPRHTPPAGAGEPVVTTQEDWVWIEDLGIAMALGRNMTRKKTEPGDFHEIHPNGGRTAWPGYANVVHPTHGRIMVKL